MVFWKKPVIETKEIPSKYWEELKGLAVDMAKVKGEIDRIDQQFKQLRGFVNRKTKLEPDSDTENNINDDGFNFLRKNKL